MKTVSKKHIDRLISEALKYQGAPYTRGAHLPSSSKTLYFDCSSFTQFLFKKIGMSIPRSSILQAADPFGRTIIPDNNTVFKKGDLIFMRSSRGFHFDDLFGNDRLSIGHVCLYIGNGKIIHASKNSNGVVVEPLKKLSKNPNYTPLLIKRHFETSPPYKVPSASQYEFSDPHWRKHSCGAVSLEMILSYYNHPVSLTDIIQKGIALDAYDAGVGWVHAKLALLGNHFGLKGTNYDWAQDTDEYALSKLGGFLRKGPVIASIHKSFNPSKGGHLVVITGIDRHRVYYNEPASHPGTRQKRTASLSRFLRGWKKRIIFLHP